MDFQKLVRSKTFWTGVSGVIGAAAGYFTGVMPAGIAIQTGVTSLLAIFLRDGVAKIQ